MVGYYGSKVSEDSRVVVCSPDLPISITKIHQTSADMTATTTTPGQPGTTGKRREPVTTTSTEESYSPVNHNKRKMISVEEAYSSNLVGQNKRKDLPKLMSIGDGYPSSGNQTKRRIISVEEAYSTQPGAPNSHQDLLKMVSMEEAYSQDLSMQNASPGQPGLPAKRKELQTTMSTEDPYQCNICSKTFAVPARLTRHYRTHTGEKPFQCEYCAKSFSVKENLSVHRRIHTKERPYKCEVCARAFEHSGKLHRHMRIHTGERPHKCQVCSKTFIQSGQLVIHMRTHTGEKPYVCGACGKGFTCSKQLKVHSRTHTGEKPYACDICGKSFGYNHVLKLHQVAHYGEKVYKCTICNDTFTSKKSMEAHIKSHSESPGSPASMAAAVSPVVTPNSVESNESILGISSPGPMSVSSVSSGSGSDKENSSVEEVRIEERYYGDYLPHGHYSHQSGVDLLAAAAVASSLDPTLNLSSPEDVLSLISSRKHSQHSQTMQSSPHPVQSVHSSSARQVLNHFPTPERQSPQYNTNYPQDNEIKRVEPSKSANNPHFVALTHNADLRKRVEAVLASSYSHNLQNLTDLSRNLPSLQVQRVSTEIKDLDHGTDIRKRVEAALASTIDSQTLLVITPPNSTSVSPASSPEPSDTSYHPPEVNSPRLEISLPPRKRSKMILKSMQMEPNVRYSSVIHYAKAV